MAFDFGQAVQGAGGGAMAGSAAGPWGALGGGALGFLSGFFGDPKDQYRGQLDELRKQFAGMQAPQAGPAQTAGYSGFRANQAGLIAQLEAMARGQGPSAAAIQMREAMDRAAAAQTSAAAGAGGRGVNAGAAYRNAASNTAAVQAQGARDTATLRAQEQLNAIGQLGQVVGQGRAADEGINTFNAGQANDAALANLQSKLTTLGISSQGQLNALLAAMGAAPQGMGTSILAGGAQAFPSILQYRSQNQQHAGGALPPQGAVTSPSQTGPFGIYTRPEI